MAWPPGLWPRGSACLAFMPSVCGVEGSRAPGPRSWPPLPTARRSAAGPASPVSEDGLAELPGEGLTSSGLHLVQRGPLATLPVDPTYLWTPEGPGCLEPRVGRVSFLGHFSFHLVSTYLRAGSRNYGAHVLQLLKPEHSRLCSKTRGITATRSPRTTPSTREKPSRQQRPDTNK